MANIEETMKNLKARGFDASFFASGKDAAAYLSSELHDSNIGFGGSVTLESLGLFETLSENNHVFWHWKQDRNEAIKKSCDAEVYITSANAVAETGEIINIDGSGNRVSSTLFGKSKVYIIIGTNKIEENFDKALWRARNIASPLNARRLNKNTPCVKGELKCYDCSSPERICRGLVVLWEKMTSTDKLEVVIIDEPLGY
jgi:Uncharacterized conserved protein containing a ferredoxin-like domain